MLGTGVALSPSRRHRRTVGGGRGPAARATVRVRPEGCGCKCTEPGTPRRTRAPANEPRLPTTAASARPAAERTRRGARSEPAAAAPRSSTAFRRRVTGAPRTRTRHAPRGGSRRRVRGVDGVEGSSTAGPVEVDEAALGATGCATPGGGVVMKSRRPPGELIRSFFQLASSWMGAMRLRWMHVMMAAAASLARRARWAAAFGGS